MAKMTSFIPLNNSKSTSGICLSISSLNQSDVEGENINK